MSKTEKVECWEQINWAEVEKAVFKLQKRIYKASLDEDIRKVRRLQKTLLRSWSNKVLSVRRVTQDNQGRKTAGVDGVKSLTLKQRYALAKELKITGESKPTRRVWIPKLNGEKRPLGIPTMYDRALQGLVKNALEPEWEARFEPNSYGFRPARRCQDAIQQIKLTIQHKAKYVLDADIAKCFDRIDHKKLLQKVGVKGQLRQQIRAWLKSGVIDKNIFARTEQGTPQGGVLSPLLANIALHGMEEGLKEFVENIPLENQRSGKRDRRNALGFIRYADDFVLIHKDKNTVLKCKEYIIKWLTDIGLELKPEKTRLTHTLKADLSEDGKAGFDFLGFHIQQLRAGKHRCSKDTHQRPTGFITLITPTKKKCKVHQLKIREVIKKHNNTPQVSLIKELNPIITGWANYYRYSDIKTVGESSKQDDLMYLKLRRWAKRRCQKSSRGYAKYWHDREYTKLNGKKSVRKEFCTEKEANNFSLKFHSDVECSSVNYVKIKGNKSPFDGNVIYWSKRKGTNPEISNRVAILIKSQKGRCNECGLHFLEDDVLEVDHIIPKTLGGKDEYKNLQLLHRHCHDKKTRHDGSVGSKTK